MVLILAFSDRLVFRGGIESKWPWRSALGAVDFLIYRMLIFFVQNMNYTQNNKKKVIK